MATRELNYEKTIKVLASSKKYLASDADKKRLETLRAYIDSNESTRLSVAEAAKLLYPKNEQSEAQENLRRFRMHVNNAFKEAGLKTVFAVDSNKKISAEERGTWFEETTDESEYIEAFNRQNTADIDPNLVEQSCVATDSRELEEGKRIIKFFVSFAEKDKDLAMELLEGLKENFKAAESASGYKYELWNYKDNLLVGDLFEEEIIKALEECHFGIVFFSLAFLNSDYIKYNELPKFISQDGKVFKKLYPVPLNLFDFATQLPKHLGKIQFFREPSGELIFYSDLTIKAEKKAFIHNLYLQIQTSIQKHILPIKNKTKEDALCELSKYQCEDLTNYFINPKAHRKSVADSLEVKGVVIGENAADFIFDWAKNPNDTPFMALLGEYGMGKTTLCKKVTKELTEQRTVTSGVLPIYFDLRLLSFTKEQQQSIPTLEEIVDMMIKGGWKEIDLKDYFKTSQELIEYIKDKKALVVFDGIDEVIVHLNEKSANDFIRRLFTLFEPTKLHEKKYSELPKAIFTCRSHYFKTLKDELSYFRLQDRDGVNVEFYKACVLLPFNDKQIKGYLERKFGADEALRVLELMQNTYDLSETAKRPLNLKMIADLLPSIESASVKNGAVYSVDLYKALTEYSLERDDGKHTISIEHKNIILSHLSAYMWTVGTKELEYQKLSEWLDEFLVQNQAIGYAYTIKDREVLKEDLRTAAFLTRQNSDKFAFAHTSLQEYFLATYLYGSFEKAERNRWDITEPSIESLEFLRQICKQKGIEDPKEQIKKWLAVQDAKSSLNIFYFWIYLQQKKENFRLPKLYLTGANLRKFELTGSEFFIDEIVLHKVDLSDAKIELLTSKKIDISDANADRIHFSSCNFNANFVSSSLIGAVFKNTDLKESLFGDSKLYGAVFASCKLSHAGMPNKEDVRFVDCDILNSIESNCIKSLKPTIYTGHEKSVTNVYVDGGYVYSSSSDTAFKIWDKKTYELVKTIDRDTDGAVVYKDEIYLYLGLSNGIIEILNKNNLELVKTIDVNNGILQAVTSDSQYIYIGSNDIISSSIKVLDKANFKPVAVIEFNSMLKTILTDDGYIFAALDDGVLKIFERQNFECIATMTDYITASIYVDDKYLYCPFADSIKIFNKDNFELVKTVKITHWDNRYIVRTDESFIYLLTSNYLHTIDKESFISVKRLYFGYSNRKSTFAVDNNYIYIGQEDGLINILRKDDYLNIKTIGSHLAKVNSVVKDGEYIYSGLDSGNINIWDIKTFKLVKTISIQGCQVSSLLLDEAHIYSVLSSGAIKIWDKKKFIFIDDLSKANNKIKISHIDEKYIYSAFYNGTVDIWNKNTLELAETIGRYVSAISAISADEMYIYCGFDDGTIKIWNKNSFELVGDIKAYHKEISSLYIDDNCISSHFDDGTIKIWNKNSFELMESINKYKKQKKILNLDNAYSYSILNNGIIKIYNSDIEVGILASLGNQDYASVSLLDADFTYVTEGAWEMCGYETEQIGTPYRRMPVALSKISRLH